ncbi:CD1247 N-terminal domain-containing protein [Thermovenabulum gondwanense]|uniref:TFIIB-type domain-containing protein n=1 Tax=Thermovenabulum gondwanense TaxID=520767 RepID=A0A162MGW8_9FIRM|nr:CD1247 N-terminal domain-containing protein [Thermovenabulum gondwanense]KYO65828.1 hypothetical protein ATZ99_14660 [Thermovenabulum gondwanense]
MSDLKAKVAYVKGLADGLGLEDSKEKRLLLEIINLLEAMAEEIDEVKAFSEATQEYVESLDEDLGRLEEDVYGDDDYEEDEDYLYEDEDEEDEDLDEDDYDDEDYEEIDLDESDLVELECPNCRETIYIDRSLLENDSTECPNCKTVINVNFDEDSKEQED